MLCTYALRQIRWSAWSQSSKVNYVRNILDKEEPLTEEEDDYQPFSDGDVEQVLLRLVPHHVTASRDIGVTSREKP